MKEDCEAKPKKNCDMRPKKNASLADVGMVAGSFGITNLFTPINQQEPARSPGYEALGRLATCPWNKSSIYKKPCI